jgi:predicted nucleic acid-binding protein
MSGVLVDTDVLIAAYQTDARDPKSGRAKDELEALALRGDGFVSLPSLAEFSSLLLTRAEPLVGPAALREALAHLEDVFVVLRPTDRSLDGALHAVEKHRLTLRDSLVWAIAHENGLSEVLTASGPGRAQIDGVRYRNPFA